jgi:hypothetical protein
VQNEFPEQVTILQLALRERMLPLLLLLVAPSLAVFPPAPPSHCSSCTSGENCRSPPQKPASDLACYTATDRTECECHDDVWCGDESTASSAGFATAERGRSDSPECAGVVSDTEDQGFVGSTGFWVLIAFIDTTILISVIILLRRYLRRRRRRLGQARVHTSCTTYTSSLDYASGTSSSPSSGSVLLEKRNREKIEMREAHLDHVAPLEADTWDSEKPSFYFVPREVVLSSKTRLGRMQDLRDDNKLVKKTVDLYDAFQGGPETKSILFVSRASAGSNCPHNLNCVALLLTSVVGACRSCGRPVGATVPA